MPLALFEGPAGSGKTTRLVSEVSSVIRAAPLRLGQRVLALTKMHGARRRMEVKLNAPTGIAPARADCQTIDGFALHLIRRWRDLVRDSGFPQPADELDFQGQCHCASRLLDLATVAGWVAATYPIVVVDELQDLKASEITMLEGLMRVAHCVCAGDEFQDLTGDSATNATTWARSRCTPVVLTGCHRTNVSAILDAADALRATPAKLLVPGDGFQVMGSPSSAHAAACVSWEITLAPSRQCVDLAVLSPTGSERSRFAREVVEWVRANQANSSRSSRKSGPHGLWWEAVASAEADELLAELRLHPTVSTSVSVSGLEERARTAHAGDVSALLQRYRKLTGSEAIPEDEACRAVQRALAARRSFGRSVEPRLAAMTVHQAKNREFDAVVVLWPFEIRKDPDAQRRLLYNAITRARRQVLVLVQDPKLERLKSPPFTP